MMMPPNQTPVLATLVDKEEGEYKCWLTVVLLDIMEKDKLPGFLYRGRLIKAECHEMEVLDTAEKGTIIRADIEVAGNPFKQNFILSNVLAAADIEEE